MSHPYVSSFRCAQCSRVFGRQRLLRRHQYFEHRVLPLDGQQLFESQKVPSCVGSGVERAISLSDSPTGKALALNAPVPLASANSRDLPRCQSPPENVLPSPGISVDFPSPSPSAHVTTENSKMGCSKSDTHSTRHVQTESTSTASTGTQTSNTEDLPLDYLRIRPPHPKSRRILFQGSKADLSAVCAPCPKLCQPLDDSLPVARTEEIDYIIMASQKDPVSSARLCDCVECVEHAISMYRARVSTQLEKLPRSINALRLVTLPGVQVRPSSSSQRCELQSVWQNVPQTTPLFCVCGHCVAHRLFLVSWRHVRQTA
jgi:hypothetical protein